MDRAQAHTLEAFTAAILLVAGLIFASQATAVTPLSASTSNQHIENQQRAMADDLLTVMAENDTLRNVTVYWNTENETFVGANNRDHYTSADRINHPFGDALNRVFGTQRIAYNIELRYWECEVVSEEECDRRRQTLVNMGDPSDNAATATRTVALFNDTEISGGPAEEEGMTLGEVAGNSSHEFYAPNVGGDSDTLYNVVEVRIIVWKM